MREKIIGLMLSLILLFGCYPQVDRKGPERDIFVFAEFEDWKPLEKTLRSTFERIIRTPQLERIFTLHLVDPQRMSEYTHRKNLLIVGTLTTGGKIGKLLEGMLRDPEIRRGVEEGRYFVFQKKNEWAKDQLLLVLVSKDLEALAEKVQENADRLFELMDSHYRNYVKKRMFARLERKSIEKQLLKKYGWRVRVQHDYFIGYESAKERFVFLRRRFPERWLFVAWIDTTDTSFLTEEWCLDMRDEIGRKFYGNDRINREFTTVRESHFLGRPGYEVVGLWENEEKVAGGPFKSYVFYDEATGRVYYLDIAVFAPGQRKVPFLYQLDIMAHTFKTAVDIKQKRGT